MQDYVTPAYFNPENFKKLVAKMTNDDILVELVDNIWGFYDLNDEKDRNYLVNRIKNTISSFHGATTGELFEKELYGKDYIKNELHSDKKAGI